MLDFREDGPNLLRSVLVSLIKHSVVVSPQADGTECQSSNKYNYLQFKGIWNEKLEPDLAKMYKI